MIKNAILFLKCADTTYIVMFGEASCKYINEKKIGTALEI